MLQTLVILYLVNGVAFVIADNFAWAGRPDGPPYVRNPGFVIIFAGILSAPIATIYFSISRAGRGGGHRLQLFVMAFYFAIAFFYQSIWLYVGGAIFMFLVRKATTVPKWQ
jgi:hypothetical protein